MAARTEPRWGWLLASFARREVLNRYAGSVTGLAWTLLHPLAQLAIFAFVFSQIFRVAVPAEYAARATPPSSAVALWPWIIVHRGLQRAMGSIAANAASSARSRFPTGCWSTRRSSRPSRVHAVGFVAVIIVLKALGEPIRLAAVPIAVVLLVPYMLLATGIGGRARRIHRDVARHRACGADRALDASLRLADPLSLEPRSARAPVVAHGEPRGLVFRAPARGASRGLRPGRRRPGGNAPCASRSFAAGLWVFNRISPHFEDFL
jgi:hypothetical protein